MKCSSLRRALLSLGLSFLSVTASSVMAAVPANDFFAAPETITGSSGSITRPLEAIDGAGVENGEPQHAGVGGISVWYLWTAPASGAAMFDTAGSAFDTILAVYTGNSVANLLPIAANDNDPTGTDVDSRVVFPVTQGTTYHIALVGQDGAVGEFKLNWQTSASGLLRFSKLSFRVSEDGSNSDSIFVERVGSTSGVASVQYEISGDSATDDDDFTPGTGTLNFANGEAQKTIPLTVVNDDVEEGDETIKVTLSGATGALLTFDHEAVVTIDDDEDNPANDKFAGAELMDGAMGNLVGSNEGGGKEVGEPVHGGVAIGHSVWYRWVATGSGVLQLDTESSTIGLTEPLDTVIAVYTGSSLNSLVAVGSNDNASAEELTSRLDVQVTTGTTYYVAIDSKGEPGTINFNWNFSAGGFFQFSQAGYTANEDAGSATITVTRTAGSTTAATVAYATIDDSAVAGQHYQTAEGVLNFAAGETSKTFNVALINNTELGDHALKLTLASPSGDALLGTISEATLTIDDDEDIPANDRFSKAQSISGDAGTTDASNVGARLDVGEPSHGATGGHSVWFKWRAPASGVVTFETAESTNQDNDPLDTLLAVYTGSFLNSLTPVVKGDNTETSVTSRVSFPVQAGVTYYIAVDGKNGVEGDIHLIWNFGAGGLIEFDQAQYTVNEKGGLVATITVQRVNGAAGTVVAEFEVADGTASEGEDYTAPGNTSLTFQPGQTTRTFVIPIINDTLSEGDETVELSLGSVSGGAILGNRSIATLSINDDEDDPVNDNLASALSLNGVASPKVYVNTGASHEAGEPAHAGVIGHRSLWFKWTAPSNGVAVFETAGSTGAGNQPLDTMLAAYSGGPGYDKLVPVAANDDADETTVTSRLSFVTKANAVYLIAVDSEGGTGGGINLAWSHSAGGIIQFAALAFKGREGQSARLLVSRVGSVAGAVGATYTTQVLSGGGATSPADFPTTTQTVAFANGQANAFIDLVLPADGANEGEESFSVVLSNPTGGAVLGTAAAQVVIDDANDDPANDNFATAQLLVGNGGTVNATNSGAGLESGEAVGSAPAGHSIWFKWVAPSSGLASFTTSGSGLPGQPLDTVLTVSAGPSLVAQTAIVSSDNVSDSDVTSAVSFAAVAGTTYYISVDAFPPLSASTKLAWSLETGGSFALSSAIYRGGEAAPSSVEITVVRSGVNVNPASVQYATANGSAVAGQDYTAKSGTLQFGPGQTVRSVVIPIADDSEVEGDETFAVSLSNPDGGASLGGLSTATVTIFDNDVVVAGDKFAEAEVLFDTNGDTNASNIGASREAGEILPGVLLNNLGSGRTVWFTWKAPTTGTAVFNTDGSTRPDNEALDTVLAVYAGNSLSSLQLVAENDEMPEGGIVSEVRFHAVSGRTYYIAADTVGDVAGDIQLHWSMEDTDIYQWLAATGSFKPSVTFNEKMSEKIVGNEVEGFNTIPTVSFTGTLVVSTAEMDTTGLDASTLFSVTFGSVQIEGVLGDDPNFVPNPAVKKGSATIPYKDSDEVVVASVKFAWDEKKLTVTVSGTNGGDPSIAIYPGYDDVDGPIEESEVSASLTFAGLTGTRAVYFDGSANTTEKTMPDDTTLYPTTASVSGSADYSLPTVAFKSPAANFRTSNATITVTGTATDNSEMSDVLYRLNEQGDFESANYEWLDEVGKKFGWTLEEIELQAGPNLIEVKAVDTNGNETISSRTIVRVAPSTIALQAVGQGTVKGNFTGNQLEVGKSYTVTATPATGWVFKNWTGGLTSDEAKFTFVMPEGGLNLTAHFVENPFLNLKGDFSGLVRPGVFNPALAGAFSLTLTGSGGFTGKLNLGAESVQFKGQFDDSGAAVAIVQRKGKTPLLLTFQLDVSGGTEQITGTVSDGLFVVSVVSDRIVFNAKTNRAPQEGTYTVALPSGDSLRDPDLPFGHGYLTMNVAANGSARLAGNLADNTVVSSSAQISKSGVMLVYVTPKNAVVAGSVLFGPAPADGANGSLNWVRNASTGMPALDAEIFFSAESFTKPDKNQRVLATLPANGQTSSALKGPGYATELTQNLVVGTDNKVAVTVTGNAGLLTLKINAGAGTFDGTIRKVGTTKTLPVKGAFMQGSGLGAGYFVDGADSGYFTIAVP